MEYCGAYELSTCRMKHGEMAYNRAEGEAQDLAELEEMDERRDGRRSFWRLLERL